MYTTPRLRRERLDIWYREIGNIGDPCVYCGVISSSYDHIPPLVKVEQERDLGLAMRNLRKYPCCIECNSHLGRISLNTLALRRQYLKDKYERKFAKWLRMPAWDETELSELGPGLKKHVKGHGRFSEGIKRRIARLGGY